MLRGRETKSLARDPRVQIPLLASKKLLRMPRKANPSSAPALPTCPSPAKTSSPEKRRSRQPDQPCLVAPALPCRASNVARLTPVQPAMVRERCQMADASEKLNLLREPEQEAHPLGLELAVLFQLQDNARLVSISFPVYVCSTIDMLTCYRRLCIPECCRSFNAGSRITHRVGRGLGDHPSTRNKSTGYLCWPAYEAISNSCRRRRRSNVETRVDQVGQGQCQVGSRQVVEAQG